MSPVGYTAEVVGLSPKATEKDVYDFFSHCGAIDHLEVLEKYALNQIRVRALFSWSPIGFWRSRSRGRFWPMATG
ncbi:hypothetical protein LIER_20076 [Lithospermum erythrorhizon]|uniref:RRM domain-containing protein n=1 Tax=Lithospermum erythrorhizon TaxID=34254 RepID=A0AAV3QK39_LITER